MDAFEIVFDSPNGYTPGQVVTGQAVLRSSKPINARFLKICIHGAAHTKWSESEHRHRDGRRDSYDEIVRYSAEINYVSGETLAWSARNGTSQLPSGHHVFPFSFPLPIDCPPSYEGFNGHIRYSVHAELDRPWKFNKKEKEYFNVIPTFDLNYLPYGNSPMTQQDVKNIGAIFKKGVVTMKVEIPKQAFSPGEYLPITIDIDNASKRPATCVRAELHQHSHYHASRHSGLMDTFCSHSTHHEHHKDETKRAAESRKMIKVAAHSQGREQLRIKIPKLPPTFQCPIISVEYCLSVKIDTETSMNNTLHCEFPLIIGTVPISTPSVFPIETTPSALPIIPSAPPMVVRTDSMPPAYSSLVPTAPRESAEGPSAPPPSYEESTSVTNI